MLLVVDHAQHCFDHLVRNANGSQAVWANIVEKSPRQHEWQAGAKKFSAALSGFAADQVLDDGAVFRVFVVSGDKLVFQGIIHLRLCPGEHDVVENDFAFFPFRFILHGGKPAQCVGNEVQSSWQVEDLEIVFREID